MHIKVDTGMTRLGIAPDDLPALIDAVDLRRVEVEGVYVGVAGGHIRGVNSRGVIAVSGRHREVGQHDIDRALAAGATHMAGIYHGCHRELCRFEVARPIVLEHYLTLFARGLGIEFEDTYKKYVHWGDPERILEDATPCMAANGLDPETARGLVIKTFPAPS